MTQFPNLYLIGAPKAGTTELFTQIEKTDEIFTSHIKEPAFFHFCGNDRVMHGDKLIPTFSYQHNEQAYLKLYEPWTSETYAIDASTTYLSNTKIAASIKKNSPDAKIIAVLRQPDKRAYSHYLMELRDGWVSEDFVGALNLELAGMKDHPSHEGTAAGHYSCIRQSLYLDGLKQYFTHFGANQLRVYLFEDIIGSNQQVLLDMSDFLGVSIQHVSSSVGAKNAFAVDRFPMLTRLINVYRYSPLRPIVNFLTPRRLRDMIRLTVYSVHRKPGAKPEMPDQAREILAQHLSDDFERSIDFAKRNKFLFQAQH